MNPGGLGPYCPLTIAQRHVDDSPTEVYCYIADTVPCYSELITINESTSGLMCMPTHYLLQPMGGGLNPTAPSAGTSCFNMKVHKIHARLGGKEIIRQLRCRLVLQYILVMQNGVF